MLVVGGSPGISGRRGARRTGRPALRGRLRAPRLPRRPAARPGRRRPVAHHRRHRQRAALRHRLGRRRAGRRGALRRDGPGPRPGPGREGFVRALLEAWDRPMVLDADAIAAAGVEALAARRHPTVITPHAGEFRRLTGEDAGYRQASDLAARTGAVVLLKGNPTVVAGAERWVVASGGPELATLGSGDVLTGMIAALIARGLDPETAARSAAFRHGRAAAHLARTTTVTAAAWRCTSGGSPGEAHLDGGGPGGHPGQRRRPGRRRRPGPPVRRGEGRRLRPRRRARGRGRPRSRAPPGWRWPWSPRGPACARPMSPPPSCSSRSPTRPTPPRWCAGASPPPSTATPSSTPWSRWRRPASRCR